MMKKSLKTILVSALVAVMTLGASACKDGERRSWALDGGTAAPDGQAYAVTVDSLADHSKDRACWLTIPDSQLVVNPFDFKGPNDVNMTADRRQTEYFDRPDMSVDVGILDYASGGIKLLDLFGTAAVDPYGGHLYAQDGFSYGWRPDRLLYDARYATGLSVDGYDYFYDENTVVRNIAVNDKSVAFWGGYSAGNSAFVRLEDELLVYRRSDGVTVAVTFSCSGSWSFYATTEAFENGEDAASSPDQSGIWCFVPDVKDRLLSMSASIGGHGDSTDTVVTRAKAPYEQNDFGVKAAWRASEWDRLLSLAPLPSTFDLTFSDGFDVKGVTAETVRAYYYRSYAMVISSVLPANPGFAYRTLSVGKASMWNGGSPESKYSCIWESLYGTQLYSFIDADIAWELCLGNMAIIPSDGNIRGESLPSNKAQTVWICHSAKKDTEKLAACVAPLERYLEWRFDNPRWILGGHNDPDEKDIDFVAAYLVDLKFMRKICNELGLTDKAAYWQDKADRMYRNMCDWFLSEDQPVQRYFSDTDTREAGTPLWVAKSLWCDALAGDELQKVLRFARDQYDREKAFAGFGSVKYDDWAYTLYGLIRNGETDIAENMILALLRDIPRSGFIGELYNAVWRGTVCEGVRPSLFGAVLMIDNVWMMNGFWYHEGGLGAVNLFDRNVGVSNIRLDDKTYALSLDAAADTLTVTENEQADTQAFPYGAMEQVAGERA